MVRNRQRLQRALLLSACLLALFVTKRSDLRTFAQTQSPCGVNVNAIVCENQNPGNPDTEWDISGSGDANIQGFTTDISYAPGDTVHFKVDTTAASFTMDIYRMGYYGGDGARKVATVTNTTARNQPNCLNVANTGLNDCGNWSESATWAIPSTAVSGIYFAKLKSNAGGASHVVFVVREPSNLANHSDMVFQTSDTTWQAYNEYGGNSLYAGGPGTNPGRAYKVSYNRPITTRGTGAQDAVFNAEYPMVRWLEANGYDVSYISGVDSDRAGNLLLQHKVYLSVGHDEYWSGPQRANVEAARSAGVHLAFFSGNEVFWKTRWESSIDGSGTPYRTLVCYKETHANGVIDPSDPPTWTGTWGDPRFSPPADGGRPQNALTGQMFGVNGGYTSAMTVPAAFGKHRFWRNTSVATLSAGQTATMPNGTLGYEWDSDIDNGFLPSGLMRLSQTTKSVGGKLLDYGSTFGTGTVTHSLTLYRASSGALVFGAGTVQWSWALDADHDLGPMATDVRMKQATVNLFADMGVQPSTLQSGLVPATASTDALAPTSVISFPTGGASFVAGAPITISGTATDAGGGLVAGVEVSTDGGTTWHAATGTTSWTYPWTVAGSGLVTIKSRAYDDTGNRETPSGGVIINVSGTRTCPCTIWDASVVPPAPLDDGDTSSVEIGDKFRTDVNGYITGVRFYKASANTGTHSGSLWTNTGVLLGTVTFTNETASGWQQAIFPSAIPVNANTTYVVSYHAPVGHYTGTDPFYTSGVDNPPLHALRDGVDGGNGVYTYGSAVAFPSNTYNSENYWVDVVFTTTPPVDTTPPTVTGNFPANNAINVDPATPITVTFSEAMDPNTLFSSATGEGGGTSVGTIEVRDPGNILINGGLTYDSTSRTATFDPQNSLAVSTRYTVLVRGGSTDPRVKDVAGNAMTANVSFAFTTAAAPPPPPTCPCSIWPASTVPSSVDDGDPASVELGTRFRSDIPGYITGARFYKASANTGTHTASLWTNTGTKLGTTATFSGESASGWQQVNFPTPVQITANTTYVISYHAPNGHYSAPDNYFTTTGVDTPPLHGLRDGVDGANGVYVYSSASTFPNQTYLGESYFVDVVFNTTVGPDVTPPRVVATTPIAGASGIRTNAQIVATFNEALDQTTINSAHFFLRDPGGNVVPSSMTYTAATLTATLTPNAALATSTQYTAVVAAGVKDTTGNATTTDFTWSFTTAAPPPPPPTQGPGGPILAITSSNLFSTYLAEILRAEGANEFATADISTVTASTLSNYDVVVLGEMSLSAAQVSMFTAWVNGGGNLIAMRPDKQLAGLAGLTDAGTTLADAYLLVSASGPGVGIVNQTMQFHGIADRYTLNGASSLAMLYSSATAATSNPAVTMKTAGAGKIVVFTYDLAKSVIYTRQGNPAWNGQERDAQTPIRSDDLYFGGSSADYVDFSKIAIPQADEQQRFLWNIILNVNTSKKPLPRFWYLPRMLTAAVIMTGDDHGYNGTQGRFDDYIAASAPNCSVVDWGCIRSTSYVFPGTPLTDANAAGYVAQGFEVALHVNTNCADYTPTTLANFYSTQLTQFAQGWPHVPAPATNRTHCIPWSDYATQPQVELNNGIRLDTTYYYWPGTWIQDRPGVFTGSGMPQRFATLTGQMIDVYQAATQMTDESSQTYPKNIDTLLNNATGALGYYGMFTANMHTDANNGSDSEVWSNLIVASAQSHGVPVISAKQALDWLDGRNGSSFQNLTWNGTVLSFNISVAAGANGLQALVPAVAGSTNITGILFNGASLPYTTKTLKGVQYAVFAANAGAYQVSYGADIIPPAIANITATPTSTTVVINWTTGEAGDSVVTYGLTSSSLNQSANNATLVLSHSITLTGLTPNTTYFYRVSSADAAGNRSTSPVPPNSPLNVTTSALSISGNVSPAGAGSGSTITVTGPLSPITAADGVGNYTVSGLTAGTYTVTPSKTGYTFSPANRSVTLTNADSTGNDFAISPVVISGTVSPATIGNGTTLTLTGGPGGTTTGNASGAFTFSALPDGTYTVTPSKTGFIFTPTSQSVTITGGVSVTNVAFTGQAIPTFSISGTVSGGPGASVSLTGSATQNVTADGSGNFSFSGLLNGSYTVTPTKSGFTMSPVNQGVTVSGANVAGVNFTATPIPTFTISGTITPASLGAGATVALTGASVPNATADASGNYSFSGLLNGTYTITPTKSGVTMTPLNQGVTVNGANVGNVNFTAAAAGTAPVRDANVTLGRATNSTSIVSPAYSTTAANELVLAFVAMDSSNANAATVNNVTGGGLTWTLVRRTNTQRGSAEIWRAFATTTLTNVTTTATLSQSVPAMITILSYKGVDTTGTGGSGAIGATGSGNANPGAPTATLVTTRANSIVIGVGNDWDATAARTPGPNQSLVQQYLPPAGSAFTFWVQQATNPIAASGTSVTINDTAPTGDRYNLTICEIKSGS